MGFKCFNVIGMEKKLRITQETDYALRIIDYLSKSGCKVVDASTISEKLKVPLRFTLKILRKLNLAGLTSANRGVKGGYYLKKEPREITYKDVLEAIEGDLYINKCLQDQVNCTRNMKTGECIINENLKKIQDRLNMELEKYTFEN